MKNALRKIWLVLAALFVFTLAACNADIDDDPPPEGRPALSGTVTLTGGSGDDGAVMVGDDVTANVAALGGSGAITYLWQISADDDKDGTYEDIQNKTGNKIDAESTMKNKWIKVIVTRANNSGSITSAPVKINAGENDLEGTVTIPKTIKVGQWIDLVDHLNGNNLYELDNQEGEVEFQWQVADNEGGSWVDIGEDADGPSYLVGVAAGKYIRVKITTTSNSGSVISEPCLVEPASTEKEITSFQIDYPPSTVFTGQDYGFYVNIEGNNLESEDGDLDVDWKVDGNKSDDTKFVIDEFGGARLYVGSDETAKTLTITVTSLFDDEWTDTATVTVVEFKAKSITITGLTGMDDSYAIVSIWSDLDAGMQAAGGEGTIADGKVTLALWDVASWPPAPWNDDGQYYIRLQIDYMDAYLYTEGMGIDPNNWNSHAKFDIKSDDETIDFADFELIPPPVIDGYKITITGLDDYEGENVTITIIGDNDPDSMVWDWNGGWPILARGSETVNGGKVTITLLDGQGVSGWKGEYGGESCRIQLSIGSLIGYDPPEDFVYIGDGTKLGTFSLDGENGETWYDYYDLDIIFNFVVSGEEDFEFDFDTEFLPTTLEYPEI